MNNTNNNRTNERMLESLVQNYGFRVTTPSKLPTRDYVYPDFTADGNTEAFRFSETLRLDLAQKAIVVENALMGKSIAWTYNPELLLEVDKIARRLGIEEQISGKVNSVYSNPFLLVGNDANSFVAYIIKPVVDNSMAWFELTSEENAQVKILLDEKVQEKPYRLSLTERIYEKVKKLLGGNK